VNASFDRWRAVQRSLALCSLVGLLLWAVGARSGPLPAKPRYVFQSVGEGTSLATRGVTSMIQDAKGFVWIGTQAGLFRCDGAEVVGFGQDEGVPHTWITQVAEGPDGTIWISAGGEVARFDGLKFVRLAGVGAESVSEWDQDVRQHIAITPSNVLFVAAPDGLLEFKPGADRPSRSWTAADGLPDGRVVAVHAGADGLVWFAAGGKFGVLEPLAGVVTRVPLPPKIAGEGAVALLTDPAGTTWLRTRDRLLRREPGAVAFAVEEVDLADALGIGTPTLDRSGNLLVPSAGGLYLRERSGWKIVSAENGLRASAVTCAIEDLEGALWVGLFGPGVQRWSGRRSWSAWTAEEGLPNDGVWGSLRDSAGRLWVGTNDGLGIWLPEEQRWKILTPAEGMAGNFVWKFAIGPLGRVWSISRRVGLNRFDPQTLEPEIVELPDEPRATVMELEQGIDGTLWIGTKENVFTVRAEGGQLVYDRIDLPPELDGCTDGISVSPEGVAWIGGRAGIGRYDGESWQHFDTKDGLLDQRVMIVRAISGNEVWIAYEESKGVTRLLWTGQVPRLSHFSAKDGLASDCVWLLETDPQGRIWIGGADGLTVISPGGTVRVFDQGDGLIWNDISRDGFWAEPDGSLLIGTSRGLAHYVPTGDVEPMRAPRVVITSAVLGGEQMLDRDKPTVSYGDNSLAVRFSGLTFRNPSRVRFKYQLGGLDTEPTVTRLREVRYAALPPGKYRFEVWCRSASGMWSVEPAAFSFMVSPPWWERWWVRLGAAVLLVGLVLVILQGRTRKLAADRRRLEAAVNERSAQLAQANEELREMSYTDVLTKAHNRRFFSTVIDTDVSATLRKHDPRTALDGARNRDLVFLLIDLDFFKKVNDLFGHRVGDEVLVETADRLASTLRRSDMLVRWGGEEFLIVCRDTERAEGLAVAQRILELIGGTPFELSSGESIGRTCSVGWAALPAYLGHTRALTYENVLELADKALYVAKETGRNRAVGVELIEEAYESAKDLTWLDGSLEEADGEIVRLTRVLGPDVATELRPSRPPPG
jgi:diguanylate cyclase (GGDEF)-like protein